MANKLTGKDLITIGIFTAIYFVINFMFMLMGGFHPLMWLMMPAFIAVFASVPIFILESKVQKFGVLIIVGLITGLIYFATGQFTVIILTAFAVTCIIGELARKMTNYNSFLGNSIAYIAFSLGMIGSPLPLWIYKESFLKKIIENGMPQTYTDTLSAYINTPMLFLLVFAPIAGGIIGIVIAKGLFKKHFEKAGIV